MVGKNIKHISIVNKAWSCHELAHLMYGLWDIRASDMERGDPSYERACSTEWNLFVYLEPLKIRLVQSNELAK